MNEVLPYGNDFKVQKIECKNHLLRNYATKLSALAKQTEYPISLRKHILSNIVRFRSDITKATKHHLESDIPFQQKISGNYFEIVYFEYFYYFQNI